MDRDELHERIMLLKQELEAGRVHIRQGSEVAEYLQKVRFAPDGKVDPSTVDPTVRAMANAVALSRRNRKLRKIPLKESQATYFDILDRFFGKPFAEMKRHNLTPQQMAKDIASRPEVVKAFDTDSKEFADSINEFWEYYGPVVEIHVQDLQCLKSVFSGDIFPSYTSNLACSVGLYVDTLVLPDPLHRNANFIGHMQPDRLLYLIVKHALNALQYKELALADLEPPIVVIAPDHSSLVDAYRVALQVAGEADLVEHSSRMFGRSFDGIDGLKSFLNEFSDSKQLVSQLADPARFLFSTDWPASPDEQLQRFCKDIVSPFEKGLLGKSVGEIVYSALLGRMMQTNDALFGSTHLGGSPIIDAPTSWQYLLWKYQYDGDRSGRVHPEIRDVLISKAIEDQGSDKLSLISGLPPEALIDLRRHGALAQLREIIRRGINEIDAASASTLSEVSEAVSANLSTAFSEHRRELEALSSARQKFFGWDASRWILFGGVSLGAATTGNYGLAILSASLGMIGAPSVEDVWKHWREVQSKNEALKRSPSGILFRHLKRNPN